MPILFAPLNVELQVTKINVPDDTKHHLANLGVLVGAILVVIADLHGNLIIKVKDGRLAINKDVAIKILVA